MAEILNGTEVAEAIYQKLLLKVSLLSMIPKLSVILVGENPASETYVRSKAKKCRDLGLLSETITMPSSASQNELLDKIHSLNRDPSVHGILVQLPLPTQIKTFEIIKAIDPKKDVDGLHPENGGLLALGRPRFIPCTPAGIIEILDYYRIPVSGKEAVVIGRSDIVGKPITQLLIQKDATVTVCHSKTAHLEAHCKRADILVVAMGKPEAIGSEFVKKGAVVIDVGIHRTEKGIVGDVKSEEVATVASKLTPVPKGVGPMTIAMLMQNLVLAAVLTEGKTS